MQSRCFTASLSAAMQQAAKKFVKNIYNEACNIYFSRSKLNKYMLNIPKENVLTKENWIFSLIKILFGALYRCLLFNYPQ